MGGGGGGGITTDHLKFSRNLSLESQNKRLRWARNTRRKTTRETTDRGLPPTCEIFVNSPGSDREELEMENFSYHSQNNYLPVPHSEYKVSQSLSRALQSLNWSKLRRRSHPLSWSSLCLNLIFLAQTFQRYSVESDTDGQVSSMTRLSVPSITPPGLSKSYGIKSVLNISLASLFPSLSASRDPDPGLSTARSTVSTSFTETGDQSEFLCPNN